jgi:hypothetical protein
MWTKENCACHDCVSKRKIEEEKKIKTCHNETDMKLWKEVGNFKYCPFCGEML